MSMTKALVVMVAALSFGFAGAALAAGAPSKSGSSTASSSKASSSKTSSQGSPAASKGAAKGALNANGPSLDGFDGGLVIFAKTDRVLLQNEASPAR
jgi:ABC-type oligopeptide transport system substrate-binding subunit